MGLGGPTESKSGFSVRWFHTNLSSGGFSPKAYGLENHAFLVAVFFLGGRETWRARRSLNRFYMDSSWIHLSSTKVDIHVPRGNFNAKDSRVETFRT